MSDLIATARQLALSGTSRPRQSDLLRAVSTAYYAMFHALAAQIALQLVGRRTAANRTAWRAAYRVLDHRTAKDLCKSKKRLETYCDEIKGFAGEFVRLQEERHKADYDSFVHYQRGAVLDLITAAEREIERFLGASGADLLTLAVELHFKDRP